VATEALRTALTEVKSRRPIPRRFQHPLGGVEVTTFVVEVTASVVPRQHRTLNEDLDTCTKDKHQTLAGNMLQHTQSNHTMLVQARQQYNMRPVRIHQELCNGHTTLRKLHIISNSSLERTRPCR
jgi:hypothetical protein